MNLSAVYATYLPSDRNPNDEADAVTRVKFDFDNGTEIDFELPCGATALEVSERLANVAAEIEHKRSLWIFDRDNV